jgi:DNA-binding helix-turn-helix protein
MNMYEFEELNKFGLRLAKLMQQNNINARQLSFAIGCNENYITPILNGKSFPKMENFIKICKALKITPQEFFNYDDECPLITNELVEELKKLDYKQTDYLRLFIKQMT